MHIDYVFLIGIYYPYGELNIMGIYTDTKDVLKIYNKLMQEDSRCSLDYSITPVIYKIPLNEFLGRKEEWALIDNKPYFYENIEQITVNELKSHIRIAEFYGFNVYCDLNFTEGAYLRVEYIGEKEDNSCWGRMSIETGKIDGEPELRQNVLAEWYRDNRQYLVKMFKTGELIDLPNWEEK